MADNEKIMQIEKIMGDPIALEPTEYEERIRRNLLIVSFLSVMAWWGGATPTGHIEIWGMSFEHLDIKALSWAALFITSYQLLHYGWVILNKLAYWRVRLTGVRLQVVRGPQGQRSANFGGPAGIDPVDYKGDEKNSNLYCWMIERSPQYHNFIDALTKQSEKLKSLDANIESSKSISESAIKDAISSLDKTSKQLLEEINNVRINVSLRRFDRWFHMMVLSQSIRWFVLDLLFPLVLGITAMIGLWCLISGGSDYSANQVCLPLFDNSLI